MSYKGTHATHGPLFRQTHMSCIAHIGGGGKKRKKGMRERQGKGEMILHTKGESEKDEEGVMGR